MTRADLKIYLARHGTARVGEYDICHVPAVKGKYGVIKKAPYYRVTIAFESEFAQDFETLDDVLAFDPGIGKTIEEILGEVNTLVVWCVLDGDFDRRWGESERRSYICEHWAGGKI